MLDPDPHLSWYMFMVSCCQWS